MSRSDLQFQNLLKSSPQKIERWVKQYYSRKPVIEDLISHGIQVDDIDDLIFPENKEAYSRSIPLLIKWLTKKGISYDVKAIIVQVFLASRFFNKMAFEAIINEFKSVDRNYRDEFGYQSDYITFLDNALLKWVNDEYAETVLRLLSVNKYKNDFFLIASVGNFKKNQNVNRAKKILIKQLQDLNIEDKKLFTLIVTLRKLKAKEARDIISKYLNHKDYNIRKEATRVMNL